MPVEQLGVDAAVLFADIMLPLASIGVPFEIRPGVGPVIPSPIRSAADGERLRIRPAEEGTPFVLEAIRLVKAELGDRAALLGFAGAPFTLACYLIEGKPSREFPRAKALMYGDPATWHRLMETLTTLTIDYLRAQIAAGADAVQLSIRGSACSTRLHTRRRSSPTPGASSPRFRRWRRPSTSAPGRSHCSSRSALAAATWSASTGGFRSMSPGVGLATGSACRGISTRRWCWRHGRRLPPERAISCSARRGGPDISSTSATAFCRRVILLCSRASCPLCIRSCSGCR